MKAKQKIAGLILIGIFSVVTRIQAQMTHAQNGHIMIVADSIKWVDGPLALPPGAKLAVIEGNPSAAALFTMRLKVPANYTIMPHWHPADEHITVIQGSCYMGLGDKMDEKSAMEMKIGGFAVMNKGTHHYFFTKRECIIQLHGMGPWAITYINPSDDPRNKNKKAK